jgi:CspA family cold shock protein
MVTGTVKWFDVKKGFGFLVNADGKDVFVHFSSIEGDGFRALKDGELVEYDEIDSGKGLAARNVKRLKAGISPAAAAALNPNAIHPATDPTNIDGPPSSAAAHT